MLAVITCFFNPHGLTQQIDNYYRFANAIAPVPLYTVEMSFSGQFSIQNSFKVNGCQNTQVLWQKERLLNLGIRHLPKQYDNIAWIDCDVLFTNPLWYEETERLLEMYPVVQMFQKCHWLDLNGSVEKSRPSSASLGSYLKAGSDQSHPGFAWAARRSQIEQWGGLFDLDITGNGDAWMTHAFYKEYDTAMTRAASLMLRQSVLQWCERVADLTGGQVAVVPGDVLHLFHGPLSERGYWDRFLIQQKHNYDPGSDIKIADNGAWQWNSVKADFHREVASRFGPLKIGK